MTRLLLWLICIDILPVATLRSYLAALAPPLPRLLYINMNIFPPKRQESSFDSTMVVLYNLEVEAEDIVTDAPGFVARSNVMFEALSPVIAADNFEAYRRPPEAYPPSLAVETAFLRTSFLNRTIDSQWQRNFSLRSPSLR